MRTSRSSVNCDRGFTLVELLVAMVVVGVVATAIASSIIVGFRTIGATTDELAQSHDAQSLSFWLLPDLQSVPPTGVDTTHAAAPATTLCTGGSGLPPNNYVLNLTWTDASGLSGASTYQADYRADKVNNQWVLERWYCSNTATTPTSLVLVHNLQSSTAATVSCTTTSGTVATCGTSSAAIATMRVKTIGPANQIYTFKVSGGGRS